MKKEKILTVLALAGLLVGMCSWMTGCDGSTDTEEQSEALTETEVSEETDPDLLVIYNEYCDSEWAEVGSDGSYLSIDTNPDNKDDYTDYYAYLAIQNVNSALGLPDYVWEEMAATRALDGTQTEEVNGISMSWTYHPDSGLNVIYKLN